MSTTAVRERWSGFLDKIETRVRELLDQAAPALPALIDLQAFDAVPFCNALNAVVLQCSDLVHKIEETWSAQVENAMEAGGADNRECEAERLRGQTLQHALALLLKRAEVTITADAATRLLNEAQRVLSCEFRCTQCRALLPVRTWFFRSYFVDCQYCQKVNTFEPGTIARMVEAFAVHAIAEQHALQESLLLMAAEQRRADKRERIACYQTYLERYYRSRAELISEYEKDLDKDVRAKLDGYIQGIA